jgi:hypothetical protein
MRGVGVARALRRISPDRGAMLLIAAVVVGANLLYLSGEFSANPLGPRADLVSETQAPLTGGQPTLDPNNGFVSQALGHRAALDLVHLSLPWWNPYEGSGTPLAGEMQSAALFPPTLLTLLGNGQLFEHILFELVAGLATFALLRRLGISRWAATAGGIAFGLNGTFAWFSHAPVNPVALLPVLLLGIERARDAADGGEPGGWWLIAVAGALSVYAGFPETAYIEAVLGVVWFSWRCGTVTGTARRRLLIKGAAGALVGALLCAPLGVATIDFFNHGDLSSHATDFYGSAHIPANGLPMLLMPYIFGPLGDFTGPTAQLTSIWVVVGGYLSSGLLMLAGLGLISRGRSGLRIVLGGWILLVFARMYGQIPLLGHVLGWLPGMARIAFFRYATPTLELPVIILAAFGINDLVRVPGHRRRAVWTAGAMLVLLAVATLAARPLADSLGSKYAHRPYFELAVAWGALVVLALTIAALRHDPAKRARLLCAVVAVDAVALFAAPALSAPRHVQVDTAPAAYLSRHLGEQRFFTLGPMQPNYGSYFGVAEADINDLPIPQLYANYIQHRLDPFVNPTLFVGNSGGGRNPFAPSPAAELLGNLNGYRELGVDYLLTPAGQQLGQSPSGFQIAAKTQSTWIYHLSGAQNYFTATGCRVHSTDRQNATATCTAPTTLIRRETDLPGWSATVDGHSAPIARADGLFQTVRLAAGTHQVQFSYEPPGILWAELAFLAGLISLAATAASARRARHAASPA